MKHLPSLIQAGVVDFPSLVVMREDMEAVYYLAEEVVSSRKGSMGSIDNVYCPQMNRKRADLAYAAAQRLREALAKLGELNATVTL